MGAGWLYYHKYPPKRKCKLCGKRHSLKRIGAFSNGEDVWRLFCTKRDPAGKKYFEPQGGVVTPYYEEDN